MGAEPHDKQPVTVDEASTIRAADAELFCVFGSLSGLGLMGNVAAFSVAGFLVRSLGPRPVYVIGAGVAVVATAILMVASRSLQA